MRVYNLESGGDVPSRCQEDDWWPVGGSRLQTRAELEVNWKVSFVGDSPRLFISEPLSLKTLHI